MTAAHPDRVGATVQVLLCTPVALMILSAPAPAVSPEFWYSNARVVNPALGAIEVKLSAGLSTPNAETTNSLAKEVVVVVATLAAPAVPVTALVLSTAPIPEYS